jgi:hypothetical protein
MRQDWGLNSEVCTCQAGAYRLSHTSSPFCSGDFGDGVSRTICPGLTSNCDPPNLSLPSGWDYRHESACPAAINSLCGTSARERERERMENTQQNGGTFIGTFIDLPRCLCPGCCNSETHISWPDRAEQGCPCTPGRPW